MKSHDECDDSRQLDRLIDGELKGDEYRAFLEALDKTPDGWRRCAMAFLETQAWGQELGQLPKETFWGGDEVPRQLVVRGNRDRSAGQVVGLLVAMAASLAVAFAGGVWWQVDNSSRPEPGLPKVARHDGAPRLKGVDEEPSQERDQEPTPGADPTEHLTFIVDRDGGESDRFELPIYNANDSVARQLLRGSPSMPADVERAIRNSGFQVKRQRQWAGVRLHDGRRAFFPVDQLEITPVSGNLYH